MILRIFLKTLPLKTCPTIGYVRFAGLGRKCLKKPDFSSNYKKDSINLSFFQRANPKFAMVVKENE